MFKKLSLKLKILAMVVPLVFWLSLVSFYVINDFHEQRIQLDGLAQVTDAFDDFGKLIDALQNERSKSAIYLAKGNVTKADLELHYKDVTEPWIIEVKRMITKELPFKKDDADQMVAIIDTIYSIRPEIQNYGFSVDDMRAAYNSLTKELMLYEGVMTKFYSAKNIEINLVNMTLVESLKDSIGKSRASFTSVFQKNAAISATEVAELVSIRSGVTVIQESPAIEIVPAMKAKVTEILETAEWQELISNMDTIVEKAATGSYGVNAESFNTKMSDINEKLKVVIDSERKKLIQFAEDEAHKAKIYFLSVLIFVLLTLVGISLFCWYVIRELVAKEAQEIIANMSAVRSASMVDNSPVSAMMCDPEGILIYMNPSTIENLKKLQQYLPEKVENLIGKSIDIFHKNPEVQRKIISDPRNLPHKAVISVGPEKLDLLIGLAKKTILLILSH